MEKKENYTYYYIALVVSLVIYLYGLTGSPSDYEFEEMWHKSRLWYILYDNNMWFLRDIVKGFVRYGFFIILCPFFGFLLGFPLTYFYSKVMASYPYDTGLMSLFVGNLIISVIGLLIAVAGMIMVKAWMCACISSILFLVSHYVCSIIMIKKYGLPTSGK